MSQDPQARAVFSIAGRFRLGNRLGGPDQGHAAARNDAFRDRRPLTLAANHRRVPVDDHLGGRPERARTPRARRRVTPLALATRFRSPSARLAWASSVAVVVPSPNTSAVRSAASRSGCAPRFSSGSGRSISLPIVTPSLHPSGSPQRRCTSTHLLLGPRVTRTAWAGRLAPRKTRALDAFRNTICSGASAGGRRPCQAEPERW